MFAIKFNFWDDFFHVWFAVSRAFHVNFKKGRIFHARFAMWTNIFRGPVYLIPTHHHKRERLRK